MVGQNFAVSDKTFDYVTLRSQLKVSSDILEKLVMESVTTGLHCNQFIHSS